MNAIIPLLLQAVAAPPPEQVPDIQITARVEAREVSIEKSGPARIALNASPLQDSAIATDRNRSEGARRYRDLTIAIDARLLLADPEFLSKAGSAPSNQPVQAKQGIDDE